MAHNTIERELAHDQCISHIGPQLARRDQDPDRNRQVIGGTGLLEVGRGQVHGDTPVRELAAGVADRSPHPLTALLDGRIGQAHHNHPRLPPVADVDLDLDQHAFESHHRTTEDLCQHVAHPRPERQPDPSAPPARTCRMQPATTRQGTGEPHFCRQITSHCTIHMAPIGALSVPCSRDLRTL